MRTESRKGLSYGKRDHESNPITMREKRCSETQTEQHQPLGFAWALLQQLPEYKSQSAEAEDHPVWARFKRVVVGHSEQGKRHGDEAGKQPRFALRKSKQAKRQYPNPEHGRQPDADHAANCRIGQPR